MDVEMVAAAAVTILSPYLRKSADAFMEHYGKTAAEKIAALFIKVQDRLGDDQYAAKTLDRVREKPDNEARRGALQEVLSEKMTEDSDFAATLLRLVQDAQAARGIGAITMAGDVRGSSTIAGSTVTNSTIVSGEDVTVVVAQRYWQGMRPTAPPEELRKATERYLRYVIDRYRYLNLKGLGIVDRIPLQLPLLGVYVPLRGRLQSPAYADTGGQDGYSWDQDVRVAGRLVADGAVYDSENASPGLGALHLRGPEPVLDLLQQYPGLIVLGDPGSGKTTLVKYLALRLALGEGPEMGLGHRLPVALPLAAYAAELQQEDVRLDDFIEDFFLRRTADLPLKQMLTETLQRGTALVLLDGLDEVRDPGLRSTVVERVMDFYTYHAQAGNKFVLTSRIVGYGAVRPSVPGLAECTLVDFDQGEIESFIDSWSAVLEEQAQGSSAYGRAEAARERRNLLTAIRSNASVARLAANPLLLTILALMHRQGISLPGRRVQLYDQYIHTLLSTWNRVRSLNQRSPARDLDDVQALRILAPLALWMHETNPGMGLAPREVVRRKLEEMYRARGAADPEAATRQFLDDVREHTGLFVERGPDTYGFVHLTFEEYLAAVSIALRGQGDAATVLDYLSARIDDPAWNEVSLLTIPYLGIIQQLDSVAGEVVEGLVARQPGRPGAAVVLAGQAVLDAWPGGVPPVSREKVLQALVPAMQDGQAASHLRRQAGLILGRLGWQPDDLDHFVEIDPGQFLLGFDKRPTTIAYRYWIGKYPVTNGQYARFIEAGGYERWDLVGPDGRREPRYWNHPELSNPLSPVVGVTWYEAAAYCRWLTGKLQQEGILCAGESIAFPGQGLVRLPTELEWERAAAGREGLAYPWGNVFDARCANTGAIEPEKQVDVSRIASPVGTSAVCTYPQGRSPDGVWDMSGNVWEWTDSWWDQGPGKRAVRGGSWVSDEESARCAACNSILPDASLDFLGFRVVVVEWTGG